jgi:hypothetical protein
MEQLVTPTRRYQELLEESNDMSQLDLFEYTEVQLTLPVEDFLVYYCWDWKDLRAFLTGGVTPKILWITEDAFLVVEESGNGFLFHASIGHSCMSAKIQATSGQEQTLILANIAYPPVFSNRVVDVFWRAIATSNCSQLRICDDTGYYRFGLPSGPFLSQFFRGSLSLHFLQFEKICFKEDHCRALATLERTDLEVTFIECTLKPQDAEHIFNEWFRHSQIVTALYDCLMEASTLAALSGNTSVKKLTVSRNAGKMYVEEMHSLLQALPGNMGIEDLILRDIGMSDETWSIFFRSLSTHPRIKRVSVHPFTTTCYTSPSAESKTARMNAILQMLQHNTVLHTIIVVPDAFKDEAVYRNSILPRLEMNRRSFRVQRKAVKRAEPSIRPQLLGRALHVVRYNPDLVFRFLSENVPAFVRTEEEDSAIPLQNDSAILSGEKRKAP